MIAAFAYAFAANRVVGSTALSTTKRTYSSTVMPLACACANFKFRLEFQG